ncbi:PolC-type DNA polymerase III [Candidatus Margulisiibacteriota bacterium]
MIADLIKDKEFQELAKEYKFLNRVKGESIETLSYVILDIETTGLEPIANEITEIGALKTNGTELKEVFSSLIKPILPIPPEITRLTGIDDELVKDAPPAKNVLTRFFDFLGSSVLVAHNADFDLSFLKHHIKKSLGKELPNSIACTVKISRHLLPNLANHKLHTVASHFGLKIANRHRAIGDAELTYFIWEKFIPMLKEKNIANKSDLDLLMSKL